jgi:APA family basic amino acid/polyamine antiporter
MPWSPTVDSSFPDSSDAPTEAPRVLGALQLTLLGIGAIVGTGIFVLGGQVAATHTGPAVTLAFGLAGLCAMLAALCYCELASMVQGPGTAYVYTRLAFGDAVGFCVGWTLLLIYTLAAASVGVGWSAYLVTFLQHSWGVRLPPVLCAPSFGADAGGFNLPALLIIGGLSAVLLRGVRQVAALNTAVVLVKFLVILAFVGVAGSHLDLRLWQPYIPPATEVFGRFGCSGLLQGTSILFFAYNGFDAISAAAPEARYPQRDIPRAICAAVLLSGLLYIAASGILVGVVAYPKLAVANPLSVGLAATGSVWLQPWLELGALAGLTSVILINLYSQPRVAYAMARDGLLPAPLGRLHPQRGIPVVATAVQGVVCGACAATLPMDWLAELMCAGTLLCFTLVSLGAVVLRYRQPHRTRPFRVPGPAWGIPLLSTLVCGALLAVAQPNSLRHLLLWILVGLLYYRFGRRDPLA